MNRLKLSFINKDIKILTSGFQTIVYLKAYFSDARIRKMFLDCGFDSTPSMISNILKKNGFVYDEIYGWVLSIKGISNPSYEDNYNPRVGKNIALSKAKTKAYHIAYKTMNEISNNMEKITKLLSYSTIDLQKIYRQEYIGLSTAKEVGWCDGISRN